MTFFSFPPQKRLLQTSQYRLFLKKSQCFRYSTCTFYRIRNNLGYARLGITIKARGLSVYRNQVKRCIREHFRIASSSLGSFDYNVVIPNQQKLVHPYSQALAQDLERFLVQSNSAHLD